MRGLDSTSASCRGSICRQATRGNSYCCGNRGGAGNKSLLPSANLVPSGDRCGSIPMIVALVGTPRKCSNFSRREKLRSHPRARVPSGGHFLAYVIAERRRNGEAENMFSLKITRFLKPSRGGLRSILPDNKLVSRRNTRSTRNGPQKPGPGKESLLILRAFRAPAHFRVSI